MSAIVGVVAPELFRRAGSGGLSLRLKQLIPTCTGAREVRKGDGAVLAAAEEEEDAEKERRVSVELLSQRRNAS